MVGLAALVVLPPAALGRTPGPTESLGKAKGLEYVRAKSEGVVSQDGAPADCDAERSATGGGGQISGNPEDAFLNATYPTQLSADGWQAEGTTTGSARTVTTYGVCGPDEVTYVASAGFVIGEGNAYAPNNACPGDAMATGGGVRGEGGNLLIVRTQWSLPPSTPDWTSVVQNAPGTGDSTVTSFAGCSADYDLRYRKSKAEVRANRAGKAIVKCKTGEAVTGGGLDFPTYNSWAYATRPWDSKDRKKVPEDGWLVRHYNGNALPYELTAFAVCKR